MDQYLTMDPCIYISKILEEQSNNLEDDECENPFQIEDNFI